MVRLKEITLAGKVYTLNFSTKATKAVSERYGDVANVSDAFSGKSVSEALDEVVWLLALLIDQGAAYREIVEGVAGDRLTIEQLEVVVGFDDITDLKTSLFGAMSAGLSRTVEVDQGKNGETTRED